MSFTAYEKTGVDGRERPDVGPEPYTDEWYEKRRDSIGASEAAAVCGLSRYAQPLDVYNSKVHWTGGKVSRHDQTTPEMRRGHIFESAVLQLYGDKIGGTLYTDVPMLIHPQHKWMVATPDALWTPTDTGNLPWSYNLDYIPVDAKTTMKWSEFGEEGTDEIPQEYVLQAQQQMAVTGAVRCDLPVLKSSSFDVTVYTVHRNEELIESIFQGEKEMVERIKNLDPPEPNWEHPKTYEIMRKTYAKVQPECVELSAEYQEMWDKTRQLSKEGKIGKEIDSIKARILHALGDNEFGALPDGRRFVRRLVKTSERHVPAGQYIRLDCKKGE